MNNDFYEYMNRAYTSIQFWPQPYAYMLWYQSLPVQYHPYYLSPELYNQSYDYFIKLHSQSLVKPNKISRNQKRAIKKKQLQQQLQREKKAIGKWVQLERKDLIQGLQKIQLQEKRIKQKRNNKFKHLIQIHKQVRKHHLMLGKKDSPNRRVNLKNKKKRLSYIKKMKILYLDSVGHKNVENLAENQWESEDESSEQNENQKITKKLSKKVKETINLKIQDLQKIKYMETGKLTGRNYQNIILRQWVRNVPNEALQDFALRLINRLAYKQAVRKVQKPTKAKKLIVSGIKECKRTIQTIIDKNRSKILIIALNIERNPLKKGVDDEVQNAIKDALQINIPIIHISTRSKLGRAFTGKFGPRITMVSIINFEGYQDMAQNLLNQWKQACQKYSQL